MSKKIGTVSVDVDINYRFHRADKHEWVGISDRLPKPHTKLLLAKGGGILLGFYDDFYNAFYETPDDSRGVRGVTHWMYVDNPNEFS